MHLQTTIKAPVEPDKYCIKCQAKQLVAGGKAGQSVVYRCRKCGHESGIYLAEARWTHTVDPRQAKPL